jgi:ABC-2 type transport system permease protein
MNKVWLVFKREYLSRVRKKTFILATILTPIGFALLFAVLLLLMSSGKEELTFGIIDPSQSLKLNEGRSLKENKYTRFKWVNLPLDSARNKIKDLQIDAILYIPAAQDSNNLRNLRLEYYSDQQVGVETLDFLKTTLANHVKDIKIQRFGLDAQVLASLKTDIELTPKAMTPDAEGKEDKGSSVRVYVATALGFVSMMIIYIMVFVYGSMVMRSVMEEKTNRIVEVIISAIRPFPLMLGKIMGVGAVGLTQFAIWAIFTPLLYLFVAFLFASRIAAAAGEGATMPSGISATEMAANQDMVQMISQEIGSFNFWLIIPMFIFFFISGYILFASFFAAIGSAMNDDWGEGQSLVMIITIPLLIAFYVGAAAIQNPNGNLAVFASIFPLFSPVVMPARMVFEPPMWQIALSMVLLIAACLFFIWLAGRIYRVGILLYGNKPSFWQLVKWIFIKS